MDIELLKDQLFLEWREAPVYVMGNRHKRNALQSFFGKIPKRELELLIASIARSACEALERDAIKLSFYRYTIDYLHQPWPKDFREYLLPVKELFKTEFESPVNRDHWQKQGTAGKALMQDAFSFQYALFLYRTLYVICADAEIVGSYELLLKIAPDAHSRQRVSRTQMTLGALRLCRRLTMTKSQYLHSIAALSRPDREKNSSDL